MKTSILEEKQLEQELLGLDNFKLLEIANEEIVSYERYETGELKVIGFPNLKHTDVQVKDVMSFGTWLETYKLHPVIKVEGLERVLDYSSNSIHLFYTQEDGLSFNWHTDDVDVLLYVIQGEKLLQFKDEEHLLKAGESAAIPKGTLHRANSRKNTVALSIEVNKEQHK